MNVLQLKFKDIAEYSDFLSLVTNIAYVQHVPLKSIDRCHFTFSEEEDVYFLQIKNPSPEEAKIYTHIYRALRGDTE